jgi:hypothetical protein
MKWCKVTADYVYWHSEIRASTGIEEYNEASLPGGEQVAFDGGAMLGSHRRDMCGWSER